MKFTFDLGCICNVTGKNTLKNQEVTNKKLTRTLDILRVHLKFLEKSNMFCFMHVLSCEKIF
jgi:hypothetical protein